MHYAAEKLQLMIQHVSVKVEAIKDIDDKYAVNCFLRTDIDVLSIGDFIIEK